MQSITERHDFILKRLRSRGHVEVSELSEELEVSEVTIRKDLRALEERGHLNRTYGGATTREPYTPFIDKEQAGVVSPEKRRIAEAAAALVGPGQAVLLGAGSTIDEVACHLPDGLGLTVVTSALPVALRLARQPGTEVLALGGLVRAGTTSVVGPYAEAMLRGHACDLLFMGVDGFDPTYGLTAAGELEASLNQAMMEVARETIVVTESTKFGHRGFRRVCDVAAVDRVVTDARVDEEMVEALRARGVHVQVVE